MLMQTMEEYSIWGFHFMEDKLTDALNYFYHETAFLDFLTPAKNLEQNLLYMNLLAMV